MTVFLSNSKTNHFGWMVTESKNNEQTILILSAIKQNKNVLKALRVNYIANIFELS